jgi:hypothetical protein
MRGTHAAVAWHIAENSPIIPRDPVTGLTAHQDHYPIPAEDFGEDTTKAHYLPIEPRSPAAPTPPPPISSTAGVRAIASERAVMEAFASAAHQEYFPIAQTRRPTLRGSGPTSIGSDTSPKTIAELFQDMLRQAYEAGVDAAKSGEAFETWYQREVLR